MDLVAWWNFKPLKTDDCLSTWVCLKISYKPEIPQMSRDLIFDIRMAPQKKKRRLVIEYPVMYTKIASSNGCSSPNMANICKHHDSLICMYIYNYIYITPKEDRKGSIYPKFVGFSPVHGIHLATGNGRCAVSLEKTEKMSISWPYNGYIMTIYICSICLCNDYIMAIQWLYNGM